LNPFQAPLLQRAGPSHVRFCGRKLLFFSGCDYFRLSRHPRVLRALKSGLRRFGLTVSASRITTGNHAAYLQLEGALADFFGAETSLLVSAGYLANMAAAQALAGVFSHAFIDQRAHPALIDAAGFLGSQLVRFQHRDPRDLVRQAKRTLAPRDSLILTDGMFAQDGAIAPLNVYRALLPHSTLLVDDSHAAGLLGKEGRGTPELLGIGRLRVIQTIALSKAFGGFGGAILGPLQLRNAMVERSFAFLGSTALPLPLVSAALESIRLLGPGGGLREGLAQNTRHLACQLERAGFSPLERQSPILVISPRTRNLTGKLRQHLLRCGIYPSFTRYPGGPPEGAFRFVISSAHTVAQLDQLAGALSLALELGWIDQERIGAGA
jgi:7-keto-8-aminopelargonate synthetase-like enzyme